MESKKKLLLWSLMNNCIILEESESIDQRINYWRGPESEFFIFLSNGMANNSKDVVYQ
jgi:hypothetical protein